MALSTDNRPNTSAARLVQTVVQAGDTILGSTSPTPTFFASTLDIPAGLLNTVGVMAEYVMLGIATTNAAAATITVDVFLDGTTSIAQVASVAPANSQTNRDWGVELYITTVGTGTSGSLEVRGYCNRPNQPPVGFTNSGPKTVDLTVPHTIGVRMVINSNPGGESYTQRLSYLSVY